MNEVILSQKLNPKKKTVESQHYLITMKKYVENPILKNIL